MICAGIDAGSRAIKVALFDHDQSRLLGTGVADQGVEQVRLVEELYDRTLDDAGLTRDDVKAVVATGYGRARVPFATTTITEITCHARGARARLPEVDVLVDIGGQDSKAIRLGPDGRVARFAMNDKCAAGTGRFLGAASTALEIPLGELGPTALRAERTVKISTTCTVFA